ncbi:MAG TPA: amidophosphoribosyltransferase [Firmicutes bacterium]|nr:amidophosphoribosyltransferase [Bacillota bacterium]
MLDEMIETGRLHEACGIFGIYGHPQAAGIVYYGLHALQHRGQESAGIAAVDQGRFNIHKDMGLVTEVFDNGNSELTGDVAIGHVMYANQRSAVTEAQPLVFKYRGGTIALAQNGALVNAGEIRRKLEQQGSIFQTNSDTEVIAHLIARSKHDDLETALREALTVIEGAYALLVLTEGCLIACLDPNGLKPLALGKIGDSYCFASETCAFDLIEAEFIRHVKPGEMIVVANNQLRSIQVAEPKPSLCSFEFIYFARPDSNLTGAMSVHQVRKLLGKQLAAEKPVKADLVLGVPDSSLSAAIGYAEALQIPYEMGLVKNRYVGRTFIRPDSETRTRDVKLKLSVVQKVVEGKDVVMVDDSIIRGTTSQRIVRLLRDAGVRSVHVRICSPPVIYPCFYGIDISSRDELIVAQKTIEQIRLFIGADSLEFLSVDGLIKAINGSQEPPRLCLACFSGQYPTPINPQG